MSKEGTFKSFDGLDLYEQWWYPKGEAKAVVVIVHGLAEHGGRHHDIAEYLNAHGFAVNTFDLRGHGKSGGEVAYVHTFDDYLKDLEVFVARVKDRSPEKPIFLLGFSMGGTIASLFLITRQPNIRGAVLSAPCVKISDDISPFLQKASSILGRIFPKLPTVKLDCTAISRDPEVVTQYDEDPLVYRKGTRARTGAELVKATKQLQNQMDRIALPLLILQGTADRLVDVEGGRLLYEGVKSGDKTLKVYDDFFHEVMREPDKERVLKDVITWLEAHVRAADR
jgi:acylglycerol lipase